MGLLFPSEEWLKALEDGLQSNQTYRDAAKDWEGDFYFIVEPDGGLKERVIAYMDLWHGECRSSFIVANENEKNPEFRIRAPLSKWRKVLEAKLNPITGMLTGQLKISGNMMKIVKTPRAAIELVNCCCRIPTEFPQ
ncbi:MAG: SCP2 sterol-binding domain-containing protein [Dehalococcoidales bacterium]|nr:SCP2 sterol-binding domain-containing protein [Dehalococcoidales bacterium]